MALAILAGGNVAFTARGQARIVEEPMAAVPDYEAGVERRWLDEGEREALGARVRALAELA